MWALIEHLPPDSATWSGGWSRHDELLARLVETTDGWGWAVTETLRRAHFKKPKPLPPPHPIEHAARPVPKVARPERQPPASPSQIQQFFAKHMSPN